MYVYMVILQSLVRISEVRLVVDQGEMRAAQFGKLLHRGAELDHGNEFLYQEKNLQRVLLFDGLHRIFAQNVYKEKSMKIIKDLDLF